MLNIGKTNHSYCACYKDQCNNSFCRYEQGSPKARLWATPFFRWGTYDDPFKTDFKIYGLDFGLDYQPHTEDLFGLFGSYRRGKFDSDGVDKASDKVKQLVADEKSELKLTSMVAGAYYRHYMGNAYALGAVFAGKVKADIDIDDDKVTGSLDGLTYGAKIELGYDAKLNRRTTLTPYGGVTYNYIHYNKTTSSNNKSMSVENITDFELEAGVKLEQMFNNDHQLPTSAYVKPSVIQTVTSGGKVKVDETEYKKTLENETIGRVEVGADAYLTNSFSIGAFGNYSFGSSYDAWAVGGHLRYIW
jgi:outer membrane autotransporter protein